MSRDGQSNARIFGRSSSHFTRCVRVFAHELGVPYRLQPLLNLLSEQRVDYGGNPALKLPALETESGTWFGALNICRELSRLAPRKADIVWPEDLPDVLSANAQELVLQGMSTEVTLVMSSLGGTSSAPAAEAKNRVSLENSLSWLEEHLPSVLVRLRPERALSFLEVSAFCFFSHLAFRRVVDTAAFPQLQAFVDRFAQRESARHTEYQFDVA